MNRRIAGLISVVLLVCIGAMWVDKQLYAAQRNGENNIVKSAVHIADQSMPNVFIADEEGDDEEEDDAEIAIDEFDLQQKQKEVRALVARGVKFCASNPLTKICRAFTHTKDFVEGELHIFLLDTKGVVYAHGEREDLLWKNLWDYRDTFGALAVQSIIKTAQAGPNWLTYEWDGAAKVSFVEKVTIEDKDYILGCGYYPHSKKYAAIGLVKGAVGLFNQDVAAGRPIEGAFSTMGYSLSERFIFGDLYLYALDFNGVIRAQGEDPNLIGVNSLERTDSKGKAINKEIISKLKEKEEGEGIWIEYTSKNALKYTYVEKVKDQKGNYYFIACGYYPEIDRDKTVDLVRRGYQYMKASGVSVAAKDFTDKANNTYRVGDLYIIVYDMKGICIAHGGNSALVGSNQFDAKDQDGTYFIRDLIDQARTGGGWVDAKINNSFESIYVEKVDMGIDSYVIGSGMFPVAKPETMILLAKNAVGYLETHSDDQAFEKFVSRTPEFMRGDLYVFAIDLDGYCYAWGEANELIWKNLLDWKDDEGKPFIKQMIEQSLQGSGRFIYKFNKRMRVTYVEQVEKGNKKYLVGSGFYR
jgi:signal transduction histidine kinase